MRHFIRWVALLTAVAAAPSLVLAADQPEETLPGFKPNGLYDFHGIDNVSLMSGDTGVSIPLGPSYSLGPGFSWELRAHQSSKLWFFDTYCPTQPVGTAPKAYINGLPTLGAGWTLELGSIVADQFAFYVAPDGGRHNFLLAPNVAGAPPYKTVDGSRLRVTPLMPGWKVEFPDGSIQYFEHAYTRPVIANSPDFNDERAGTPALTRYGLTRTYDSFGTKVLSVDYDSTNAWQVTHVHLDPDTQPRTIDFNWTSYPVPNPYGATPTFPVLGSIDFPGTAGQTVNVAFGFQGGVFSRNFFGSGTAYCPLPQHVAVPLLSSITSAPSTVAETYSFAYALPTLSPPTLPAFQIDHGALKTITLPTGGTISYDYAQTLQDTYFTCGDLRTLGAFTPPPGPLYTDPEVGLFQDYLDDSPAVVVRTETDPGRVSSVTTYDRLQCAEANGVGSLNPFTITRRVVVTRPNGNGGTLAVRHLLHFDPNSSGLLGGLELMRFTYADGNITSTPIRSSVACHEGDLFPGSAQCGYKATDGSTTTGYNIGNNARVQKGVTWYGPSPLSSSGSDCSQSSTPCVQTARDSATYDTNAGEYQDAITTTNSSLLAQPGWTSRTEHTHWTPSYTTNWLLKLYDQKSTSDAGSVPSPSTVATTFDFSPTNGFLNLTDTADPTYGSIHRDFSPDPLWNVGGETAYGTGQTSGTFTTNRSFASGKVLTSQRTGLAIPWLRFDVDRDPASGQITKSRDPNGLETNYLYDGILRLQRITPPGGEAATTYCYALSGGPGAYVVTNKGISTSCSTNFGAPSPGSGTGEAWQYDGLGRPIRHVKLLPNTLSGGSYLAVEETRYNDAGLRFFQSEWTPCLPTFGSADVKSCFATDTTLGTTFSSFDPFGRPQLVTKADGTTTTISFTDGPILFSDSLTTVTASNVGGGPSTTIQRKDLFGRLVSVTEPDAGSGPDTTSYKHNVLDKVALVTQGVQTRSFLYDSFGFLRSETHPENGTTTYSYDALGDVTTKTENDGHTESRTYDKAGRLLELWAGMGTPSTPYQIRRYDGACTMSCTPGLYPKGNVTEQIDLNPAEPMAVPLPIRDALTYFDPTGRLSTKTIYASGGTLPQNLTYDALGNPATHSHPHVGVGEFQTTTTYQAGFPIAIDASGSQVGGTQPIISSATYAPSGALASYTTGNGVLTTITQDPNGLPRPSRFTAQKLASTLFDTGDFTYDGAGNVTAEGVDQFTYDKRSRLLGSTLQGPAGPTSEIWTWDRYGNPLTHSVGASTTTYTPNASSNHLGGLTYDGRGNVTGDPASLLVYDFDDVSRLTRTGTNTGESFNAYDFSGDRIVRTEHPNDATCLTSDSTAPAVTTPAPVTVTQTTCATGSVPPNEPLATLAKRQPKPLDGFTPTAGGYKLYFTLRGLGRELLTEYQLDASAVLTADHVYLGSLLVATHSSSPVAGWTFFSSDHLGTKRLATNLAGNPANAFKFRPFGTPLTAPTPGQGVEFAGMEKDALTGNHYDHARFYSAGFGRFLAPDSLGGSPPVPGSLNRYHYALANPLKYVDPDGREVIINIVKLFKSGGSRIVRSGLSEARAIELYKLHAEIDVTGRGSGQVASRMARQLREELGVKYSQYKGSRGHPAHGPASKGFKPHYKLKGFGHIFYGGLATLAVNLTASHYASNPFDEVSAFAYDLFNPFADLSALLGEPEDDESDESLLVFGTHSFPGRDRLDFSRFDFGREHDLRVFVRRIEEEPPDGTVTVEPRIHY